MEEPDLVVEIPVPDEPKNLSPATVARRNRKNSPERVPTKFTEQMRRFAVAYAGNAAEAARAVGVSAKSSGHRGHFWLGHPEVQKVIKEQAEKKLAPQIKSKRERQRFWSEVMGDEKTSMVFRLRASELLGKSQGDFLERIQTTHSLELPAGLTLDEVRALASRPLPHEVKATEVICLPATHVSPEADAADAELISEPVSSPPTGSILPVDEPRSR